MFSFSINRVLVAWMGMISLVSFTGCMPVVVQVHRETKGVVLDADTSAPIRNARVTVEYVNTGIKGSTRTTTDAAGKFTIGDRYGMTIMVAPNDINEFDSTSYSAVAEGYVNATSGDRLSPLPEKLQHPPVSTFSSDPALGIVFRLKRVPPPAAALPFTTPAPSP